MRVKTSVTLPESLLGAIDRVHSNRSAFLERAARQYLTQLARKRRDARDSKILNTQELRLNEEAADVLEYQILD